jgi:hypothetical protein
MKSTHLKDKNTIDLQVLNTLSPRVQNTQGHQVQNIQGHQVQREIFTTMLQFQKIKLLILNHKLKRISALSKNQQIHQVFPTKLP